MMLRDTSRRVAAGQDITSKLPPVYQDQDGAYQLFKLTRLDRKCIAFPQSPSRVCLEESHEWSVLLEDPFQTVNTEVESV